MKKTVLYFALLLIAQIGFSQGSNGVRVTAIVQPNNNIILLPNDSAVLVIEVFNSGPNEIIAADNFRLRYNLSNASGSGTDFDTLLNVGSPGLAVGTSRTFVVDSAIRFDAADVYSICADLANGTDVYPTNTEKFPGECRTFTVNIDKVDLKVDQLYYAEGNIHFTLNERSNYQFEVYNITGKLLLSTSARNLQNHQIKLPSSTKGFYFLKVIDSEGRSATSRFVIH